MFITSDEAEARAWLDEFYKREIELLKHQQEKSYNADYDFY